MILENWDCDTFENLSVAVYFVILSYFHFSTPEIKSSFSFFFLFFLSAAACVQSGWTSCIARVTSLPLLNRWPITVLFSLPFSFIFFVSLFSGFLSFSHSFVVGFSFFNSHNFLFGSSICFFAVLFLFYFIPSFSR